MQLLARLQLCFTLRIAIAITPPPVEVSVVRQDYYRWGKLSPSPILFTHPRFLSLLLLILLTSCCFYCPVATYI